MATAGGAKMEPASCAKQSRSRNALRCLRSVPLAERHSAEDKGGGGSEKRDVKGAWFQHVVPPRATLTSRDPPSCRRTNDIYASLCASYFSRMQLSQLKRLVGRERLM